MSLWWRAYVEAANDPKLQMLSDSMFRAWFNIMCLASNNGGALPPIAAVAFWLRKSETATAKIIETFRACQLVDEIDGQLRPHNWDGRQYKSDVSTERVKRFRKRSGNVSETANETDQRQSRDRTEQKDAASAAPDPKADLFRRGREVLGNRAGALIAKLLRSIGSEDDAKVIAKARARLEEASTKAQPVEWIARVMNGPARVVGYDGQPFPDGIT